MRWAAPLLLLLGCTGTPAPAAPDLGAAPRGPAGLFEDCVPASGEIACAAGLRCGLVRVNDAPYQATVAQCVPVVSAPLAEDAPCSYSEETEEPAGAAPKRFDRCAAGAACVDTTGGPRCRALCALRVPKGCGAGRLCVLPSPVASVGFCAAPDGCAPLSPQGGCPAGGDGQPLGCYVLTESKQERDDPDPPGGTFCLARVPLGDSGGALGERCERSANCRPGLSCVAQNDRDDPTCRPYCPLPFADAGVPDGGFPCADDLGMCQPIAYWERTGRCY
jgi:hypothetical protein